MYKEIFKNTTFQFFSRIITTGIGFILTILIARHFGANSFGEFVKITSFVTLFYLFVDFGINAIFIKGNKNFSSLFYLRLILAVVIFVAANSIAFILPYDVRSGVGFSDFARFGIFVFSFSLFSQAIIFSTSGVFQKKLNYKLFMVSQVLGGVFNLFLIALLIFFAKPLGFIILSFTLSSILTAIISLILATRSPSLRSGVSGRGEKISTFDITFGKKLFISSIPLGLMLIFNLIYFRVDILLLSVLKPNADIGIYSIAYKFFDFFIAIPLFLSNSLYPKMLDSLNNKIGFSKIVKNYFLIYLVFSILIVIPVWFLSPMFSLISAEFANAGLPFRILILSLPMFFLTSFIQWVLIAKGVIKFLMYAYLLSALLNIGLNIIFIPQFSYIASAAVTPVSEAFVLVLLLFKFRHNRILSEKQNGN